MDAISLPEGAKFTCQSCGQCCQGWSVPVDQPTVDRLRAHDWGGDPFERTPGASTPFRLRLVDGRCFFLDSENRCRIHIEVSYEAKPDVCRGFPLTVLDVGGRQYARLSYWCPTVAENTGRPLQHQVKWLKDTARHADRRDTPITIEGTAVLDRHGLDAVHRLLSRLLREQSLPVGDRLAAAAAFTRRLSASAGPGVSLGPVLSKAEADGPAALARETKGHGHASGGRRALSLYLMQDRQSGRLASVGRFVSMVMFQAGLMRLRSWAVPGRASWSELRRVTFDPAGASRELLARYFCSKIDSRRYIAGDATLVTGVNLLVAAYGVINVLARVRAASQQRTTCDDEDVTLAVRAADLLVVEHPGLHQGAVHRRLVETAMDSPDLCADLFACLES